MTQKLLFVDRMIDAIETTRAPVCVGIDPMPDVFPTELVPKDRRDLDACVDSIYAFCSGVLQAVAGVVPVVKFQSAYFERYLWQGVQAYYELIHEAKQLGLLVIGDVKRGDIGSTSQAYADAHLGPLDFDDIEDAAAPDAITINPYLGMDAIDPFLQTCVEESTGVFVLVRTSNPGSKDVQDIIIQNGCTLAEHVADLLHTQSQRGGLFGQYGYANVGAVVGATQAHTMVSLRAKLPSSYFLLPGYGTQGATADMTSAAFDASGRGAIVSASRSVLYPKPHPGESWQDSVARAARKMVDDVRLIAYASHIKTQT
jgi:orotidine-5'-phosphate decarboxylase